MISVTELELNQIREVPDRVRDRALRIIRSEGELWGLLVRQFGYTNPSEVTQLSWLVDLAKSKGARYLVELCKLAKKE